MIWGGVDKVRLFLNSFFFLFTCHFPCQHVAKPWCQHQAHYTEPAGQSFTSLVNVGPCHLQQRTLLSVEERWAGCRTTMTLWCVSKRIVQYVCNLYRAITRAFASHNDYTAKVFIGSQKCFVLNYYFLRTKLMMNQSLSSRAVKKKCHTGYLLLSVPVRTLTPSSVPKSACICCRQAVELVGHWDSSRLQLLFFHHSLQVRNVLVTIDLTQWTATFGSVLSNVCILLQIFLSRMFCAFMSIVRDRSLIWRQSILKKPCAIGKWCYIYFTAEEIQL